MNRVEMAIDKNNRKIIILQNYGERIIHRSFCIIYHKMLKFKNKDDKNIKRIFWERMI